MVGKTEYRKAQDVFMASQQAAQTGTALPGQMSTAPFPSPGVPGGQRTPIAGEAGQVDIAGQMPQNLALTAGIIGAGGAPVLPVASAASITLGGTAIGGTSLLKLGALATLGVFSGEITETVRNIFQTGEGKATSLLAAYSEIPLGETFEVNGKVLDLAEVLKAEAIKAMEAAGYSTELQAGILSQAETKRAQNIQQLGQVPPGFAVPGEDPAAAARRFISDQITKKKQAEQQAAEQQRAIDKQAELIAKFREETGLPANEFEVAQARLAGSPIATELFGLNRSLRTTQTKKPSGESAPPTPAPTTAEATQTATTPITSVPGDEPFTQAPTTFTPIPKTELERQLGVTLTQAAYNEYVRTGRVP